MAHSSDSSSKNKPEKYEKVSPQQSIDLSIPIPSDPSTQSTKLHEFLQQFQNLANIPYIHPKPITFPDGKSKTNWISYLPDATGRDTFSQLWANKKQDHYTWIAFFSTWTKTWVGDIKWDERPWHCWVAALIYSTDKRERYILIWDCDPRSASSQSRPSTFLLSIQYKFLRYVRSKGKFTGLWYNQNTSYKDQNRCLFYSLQWLTEMVSLGDIPYNISDERVRDCVLIRSIA
jgi:hypothetical protein